MRKLVGVAVATMTDSPNIRVLLVDDEPLARAMLREMLQGDPQVVIVGESCNGREALEAIHVHSPDLLFLDVRHTQDSQQR